MLGCILQTKKTTTYQAIEWTLLPYMNFCREPNLHLFFSPFKISEGNSNISQLLIKIDDWNFWGRFTSPMSIQYIIYFVKLHVNFFSTVINLFNSLLLMEATVLVRIHVSTLDYTTFTSKCILFDLPPCLNHIQSYINSNISKLIWTNLMFKVAKKSSILNMSLTNII